jgi:hypothetical protein
MTMQHESHPHDERLAALAGADREAIDDRALRDHVASCDRCGAVVDDLALLRSSLAELPDLQPSRPLQLLPPVAAPAAPRRGVLGTMRRLSAPALAAGAGLILVGVIGTTGVLEKLAINAASAPLFSDSAENVTEYGASPAASDGSVRGINDGSEKSFVPSVPGSLHSTGRPTPTSDDTAARSPSPREVEPAQGPLSTPGPDTSRLPWLLVLSAGVVLVGGSLLLRFTVQPRAG